MIRQPAVAGQFYPSDPQRLKSLIASLLDKKETKKERAVACVLPHAGYVYSAKVAAAVLSSIDLPDTCVILGPNHTGFGTPAGIMTEGKWQMPFGTIDIDDKMAHSILKRSSYLQEDEVAHAYEHSIEVQLPLIRQIKGATFRFVPIILASDEKLMYKDIAHSIATAVQEAKKDVLIVASSDMTHYEPQKLAMEKDQKAIEAVLALDADGLEERIQRLQISMCGYIPAIVAIMAAKELGARTARLAAYQTSGDVSGDYSSVVGYAGIVIS
ncbi:AmmeMemoRadiSam system protein B [Candidatus Velamenicoccus archaeovorus]|uniref:MEMO1 family protein BU251_03830 n=1 Tax=Velamenicoccus archaeovorus TaxID=1930593 RepID=A0A410P464_VELA1|nr:AmmeMemoRadiSam system protein B [Candidatus Velamenicoccus archaeovorus]QAT16920.1 AmmeMemoRadiSam system protein B [Candidatus Velamenicoccus archaeovorus]